MLVFLTLSIVKRGKKSFTLRNRVQKRLKIKWFSANKHKKRESQNEKTAVGPIKIKKNKKNTFSFRQLREDEKSDRKYHLTTSLIRTRKPATFEEKWQQNRF